MNVFGSELESIVEAGGGLVVGTVSADGAPRGGRAWAAWIVDRDARRIRIVVGADDAQFAENLTSGDISLNAAHVLTYQSIQVKGRIVVCEPPSVDDLVHVREHTDRFFAAVQIADGNPMELLERMLPGAMMSIEMVVDQQFDQTPGPEAGALLGTVRS